MFTGIVTGIGTVLEASGGTGGLELDHRVGVPRSRAGRERGGGRSLPDGGGRHAPSLQGPGGLAPRSIEPDSAEYAKGRRVNLERALRVGDRLGGHLVQAHVDGVGTVEPGPETRRRPAAGSAGSRRGRPSLGAARLDYGGWRESHGQRQTGPRRNPDLTHPVYFTAYDAGRALVGDRVHLEADTIGKYVAALLAQGVP